MNVNGELVYYVNPTDNVAPEILELDIVVTVMVILTLVHSIANGYKGLFLMLVAMAHIVEQCSVRLGGTHCHEEATVMVGVCSSMNSIWIYVPWFYTSFVSCTRLVKKGYVAPRFAAFAAGMFSFSFCGAYEMQGPNMLYWKWPDLDTHLILGKVLWQLEPDAAGRGLLVTEHCHFALKERAFNWPLTAPLYHVAMGIGLVQAVQICNIILTPRLPRSYHHFMATSPLVLLISLFLMSPLALLWDLPVRVLEWMGVSKYCSVPLVMLSVFVIPVLCHPQQTAGWLPGQHAFSFDWLLLSIPLINSVFLCTRSFVYPGRIEPDLYLIVVMVSIFALMAHYKAARSKPASGDMIVKKNE